MVRRRRQSSTGATGQRYTEMIFSGWNWLPTPVPQEYDVGTDLWVTPVSATEDVTCAQLGVQVKTSKDMSGKYFRSPRKDGDTGEVLGWDVAASRDHTRYWLNSNIPHLLVVHCREDQMAYWAHVEPSAVQYTDKGAKIFVPRRNLLVEDQRDEIMSVAALGRRPVAWEGSLWSTVHDISPEEHLRAALLTPRLVAPHPNHVPSAVEPYVAVAMLVQLRLRELDGSSRLGRESPVPKEPAVHDDWTWRFYAALKELLFTGDSRGLADRVEDACTAREMAAATAALCAIFYEAGRAHDALSLVTDVLRANTFDAMDRVWLTTHQAWALFESTSARAARDLAATLQIDANVHGDDVTGGALRSSLADLMFVTADIGQLDIKGVLTASDTPADWWRDQTLGYGTLARTDNDFTSWLEGQPDQGADKAWRSMRSAMLMAGFASNRGDWQRASRLTAQEQAMTADADDMPSFVDSLHMLRYAGHHNGVRRLAQRLRNYGPALAVRQAAQEVDLTLATHSSIQSDLELLATAGDVLDPVTADATLDWLLRTMAAPAEFMISLKPTFLIPRRFIQVCAAVAPALSGSGHNKLVEHLMDLSLQEDQGDAQAYGSVLDSLPAHCWPAELVAALAQRSGDNFELVHTIDRVRAKTDDNFREGLRDRIASGDLNALHAYGDVRTLEVETIATLTDAVAGKVQHLIDTAGRGYSVGGHEPLRTLTLLAVQHPSSARWDLVIEALSRAAGSPDGLSQTLLLVASVADEIPDEPRLALLAAVRALKGYNTRSTLFNNVDVAADAHDAENALEPGSVGLPSLTRLLQGSDDQRQSAVLVIARQKNPADISVLACLAATGTPNVRATVAHSLARWICDSIAIDAAGDVLSDLLQNSGTSNARSSATILKEAPRSDGADVLAQKLTGHPSAAVRSAVATYETHT